MNPKAVGTLVVYGCVFVGTIMVVARIQRTAQSPDFGRTVQMRFWRGVKVVANGQADWWGELGLKAGTHYNKCRL